MTAKIVSMDHLGLDEALNIEGDFSRFSNNELESFSSGFARGDSLRSSLENGELALISDSPTFPDISRLKKNVRRV